MAQETTGTRDVTFDVISVLYHALETAHTTVTYEEDARDEGQAEIADFFKEVIATNRKIADGAKEILRKRLQESGAQRMGEKDLDNASADSFPASDPPAVY